MGILFLILKIIGIVFLGLLALFFLALFIILFVPFRYRIHASYYDTADIHASVSWLLHAISVQFRFSDQERKCQIKVLGLCIMDLFHPKPRKEKKRKKKSDTVIKEKKQIKQTIQTSETGADIGKQNDNNSSVGKNEKIEKEKAVESGANDSIETAKQDDNPTSSEDDTPKESGLFEKISLFFTKIKETVLSLQRKIRAIREKQIDLQEQARKWMTVLKRDRTKTALGKCKDILIKLLKTILPRKWSAYFHFGMDDPASTAQILGYYWMFIGVLANHVTCLPDFENKIFEGELKAKGHIRMITFVSIGLKVLFDPDLIYLRKIKAEVDSL